MRFLSRALVALAALATTSLASPLDTERETVARRAALPDPNDDPFYTTPSNIDTYSNGQIIATRKVPTDIGNENNAASYQLAYRSLNTQGQPQTAVATVWVPAKPVSPPKILSYQFFEDSTQLDCSPSYNFLTGTDQPNKGAISFDAPIIIGWALQNGYYAVSPDHEGPESAFIAGYQEGMATLDALRAAKNYLKLPSDTPVALTGYSGGASATVWAETLAGSYAPDVNIIGSAHGGTPVSAKDTFNFINGGPVAGFALAGISGLALAYPSMESFIEPRLNAKGQAALKAVRSRGFCLPQVVSSYPFVNVFTYTNESSNLINEGPIPAILKNETVVQSEASWTVPVPKFPRFIWHAIPDEIVPYAPAAAYVKEQCAKGADIFFSPYPIAEHVTAEILGIVPSLWWLGLLFKGQQPKVQCGGFTPALAGAGGIPNANTVLGTKLASQLSALNGKSSPFGGKVSFPATSGLAL